MGFLVRFLKSFFSCLVIFSHISLSVCFAGGKNFSFGVHEMPVEQNASLKGLKRYQVNVMDDTRQGNPLALFSMDAFYDPAKGFQISSKTKSMFDFQPSADRSFMKFCYQTGEDNLTFILSKTGDLSIHKLKTKNHWDVGTFNQLKIEKKTLQCPSVFFRGKHIWNEGKFLGSQISFEAFGEKNVDGLITNTPWGKLKQDHLHVYKGILENQGLICDRVAKTGLKMHMHGQMLRNVHTGEMSQSHKVISTIKASSRLSILGASSILNTSEIKTQGIGSLLHLKSDYLANTRTIESAGDLFVEVKERLDQAKSGRMDAKDKLNVKGSGAVVNHGFMEGRKKLLMGVKSVDNWGDLKSQSLIFLRGDAFLSNKGNISSREKVFLKAPLIGNSGVIKGKNGWFKSGGDAGLGFLLEGRGILDFSEGLTLMTRVFHMGPGTQIKCSSLEGYAVHWGQMGKIEVGQNACLSMDFYELGEEGILTGNSISLNVWKSSKSEGLIEGKSRLHLNGGVFHNKKEMKARQITGEVEGFINEARVEGYESIDLSTQEFLNKSRLTSGGILKLSIHRLGGNHGTLSGAKGLNLSSLGTFENNGEIISDSLMEFALAGTLNNLNLIRSLGLFKVTGHGIFIQNNLLEGYGGFDLQGSYLKNTGKIYGGKSSFLQMDRVLNLGEIISKGSLQGLSFKKFLNKGLLSGDSFVFQGDSFKNFDRMLWNRDHQMQVKDFINRAFWKEENLDFVEISLNKKRQVV